MSAAKEFAKFLAECDAIVAKGPAKPYAERRLECAIWDTSQTAGGENVDDSPVFFVTPEESRALQDALRWIPVGDRLPTHIHSVMIRVVGGPGHDDEDFTDIGIYNVHESRWQMNLGDDDVVVQVSHWMPLPEEP